jgi:Tol biopolymer transport system component
LSDPFEFSGGPDRMIALAERSVRRGYRLRRRRRVLLSGGPALVIVMALVAALVVGGGHGAEDRLRVTRRGPDRHEPTTVPAPDGGPKVGGGSNGTGPGSGAGSIVQPRVEKVPPASGGQNAATARGRIVFSDGDIKVIDDDGTSMRSVVRDASQGTVSPDGLRIAFVRTTESGGGADLYVATLDGGVERRVGPAEASGTADRLSWAPDGRRLAYTGGSKSDVHVVNADGSGDHAITSDGVSQFPSWSPDGKRIVFLRGSATVFVVNDDGSGAMKIGPPTLVAQGPPVWSPAGRFIAFPGHDQASVGCDPDTCSLQVWVMGEDGSNPHRAGIPNATQAAWSPDGSLLALGGMSGLGVVHPEGGVAWRLASGSFDLDPAWSSDGAQLAFVRSGSAIPTQLWVVGANGSGARKITGIGDSRAHPCWIPRG